MINHVYLLNTVLELLMKTRYVMTSDKPYIEVVDYSDADMKQKTG